MERSLGAYSLSALTPEIIGSYRDARLAEGRSGSTVRLELALLSHLFTVTLREWGMGLPANPVLLVRKPKTARRERRLEGGEQERLMRAVRAHGNPLLAWVTELALETVAREMELLSLRVQDVHLDRRIATFADTKNNESRTIPLSRRAVEILREALDYPREGTDLIFPGEPGRDGGRRPYTIGKVWQQAVQRAGLSELRFHDLRHEATSRLVEAGLSDAKVRQITGHRSAQMLYHYAHLRGEDLVRDLDAALPAPARRQGTRQKVPSGKTSGETSTPQGENVIRFPGRRSR